MLLRAPTAITLALLALPVVAPRATRADVTVRKDDGSLASPAEATVAWDAKSGGYDITLKVLYNPGGYTEYDVVGTDGVRLDDVIIDVDGPAAGSPLFVDIFGSGAGISEIHRIEQTGTAETFVREARATGNIGSITARDIGTVRAGGDITGPIVSITPNNPMRGVNWVEADGAVTGDVIADQGRIGLVYGHAQLGAPGAPITIRARHYVNGVSSLGDIHAHVNTRVNGGHGGIYIFHAGGAFHGTLETRALVPDWFSGAPGYMNVLGGLDGTIVMDENFTRADQFLRLPVAGLRGQIIINASNQSGSTHWTTPVYVGPNGDPDLIVLDGPGYDVPAEPLGGGSIGVVPFDRHAASTMPVNGATLPADAPVEIALRHYGPVTLGLAPIAFARRAHETDPFETLTSAAFDVTLHPDDPRTVVVRGSGFEPGWTYRLRGTDDLRCAVPGTPAVTWSDDYLVTIEPAVDDCPADVGGNGAVDVGDVLIVLGAWGQSGSVADVTGDGVVNVADLLAVLSGWGACP